MRPLFATHHSLCRNHYDEFHWTLSIIAFCNWMELTCYSWYETMQVHIESLSRLFIKARFTTMNCCDNSLASQSAFGHSVLIALIPRIRNKEKFLEISDEWRLNKCSESHNTWSALHCIGIIRHKSSNRIIQNEFFLGIIPFLSFFAK